MSKVLHTAYTENVKSHGKTVRSILSMDYVDKRDVDVFTVKLTLVMYRRENGFESKLYHFQQ